jgi:predicted GIY-YIG superfamily endonuclease
MDFDCVVDVSWHLYVVRCRGGELYTGIATDVVRRLSEHESGAGAKYLRGKGPLALVFSTSANTLVDTTSPQGMLNSRPTGRQTREQKPGSNQNKTGKEQAKKTLQ